MEFLIDRVKWGGVPPHRKFYLDVEYRVSGSNKTPPTCEVILLNESIEIVSGAQGRIAGRKIQTYVKDMASSIERHPVRYCRKLLESLKDVLAMLRQGYSEPQSDAEIARRSFVGKSQPFGKFISCNNQFKANVDAERMRRCTCGMKFAEINKYGSERFFSRRTCTVKPKKKIII